MRVKLSRGQWTIVAMLLAAMALEFIFSPYWHKFYGSNIVTGSGKNKSVSITTEGLMVLAFLLFTLFVLAAFSTVSYKGAFAISGLLLLAVVLARAQPIIDWMDATTAALKKASGS